MFKHYFDGFDINSYSIFSLLVFFLFFVGISIWLMKADKKYIQEMSVKPLEENESTNLS